MLCSTVINNYVYGVKLGMVNMYVKEVNTIDSKHKKVIFDIPTHLVKNIEKIIGYKLKPIWLIGFFFCLMIKAYNTIIGQNVQKISGA